MNKIPFDEAKVRFVQSWGNVATNWGVSKTMGMVHALLLIADKPLNVDDLASELEISRSNANMTVRTLLDWNIVYKKCCCGERKEFYVAEKNLWKVFIRIIEQRKSKELDPIILLLNEMASVEAGCDQSTEFLKVVNELSHFSKKADNALDNIIKSESSFLMQSFIRMMR
ncbi:MAG: transcriptional regulator [Saprospiraceae bacterium]|nr:transcriptional regulator [Saprospiraceae bacterium]